MLIILLSFIAGDRGRNNLYLTPSLLSIIVGGGAGGDRDNNYPYLFKWIPAFAPACSAQVEGRGMTVTPLSKWRGGKG